MRGSFGGLTPVLRSVAIAMDIHRRRFPAVMAIRGKGTTSVGMGYCKFAWPGIFYVAFATPAVDLHLQLGAWIRSWARVGVDVHVDAQLKTSLPLGRTRVWRALGRMGMAHGPLGRTGNRRAWPVGRANSVDRKPLGKGP